jgi:hypothetical protein
MLTTRFSIERPFGEDQIPSVACGRRQPLVVFFNSIVNS